MTKEKKDYGCYMLLSQNVGNTIKFYMDDGKAHHGKIVKIFVTMTEDGTETEYEVKTRFRGKQDYARIKSKDIIG
jgi:hypothetical protein